MMTQRARPRLLALVFVVSWLMAAPLARAEGRSCETTTASSSVPKAADSAPAYELVQTRDFVLVADAGGPAGAACGPAPLAHPFLRGVVEKVHRQLGIDPALAILLATEPTGCDGLFYLPVANDVRGIGYQHVDAREVFDDSPESRLEGIAFLNDFAYWRAEPVEFARAFNHEVGHRWGSRVHVARSDLEPHALLGREQQHWSYFLDTGGSPLEGNTWRVQTDGRFEVSAELGGERFSDFDLYLMGLLPPAEVGALHLFEAHEGGQDCLGRAVGAPSPPQICAPLRLAATPTQVTIADVVAAEGAREPSADAAPRSVDVSIIVFENGAPLDRAGCTELGDTVAERIAGFADATGGRLTLHNLASGASCEDALPVRTPERSPAQCAAHMDARGTHAGLKAVLLALFAAACARRARARHW